MAEELTSVGDQACKAPGNVLDSSGKGRLGPGFPNTYKSNSVGFHRGYEMAGDLGKVSSSINRMFQGE